MRVKRAGSDGIIPMDDYNQFQSSGLDPHPIQEVNEKGNCMYALQIGAQDR
ncbi:hypothetical protein KDK_56180 [Dictyobacter kobayashii]|uniref:Uncharacterized protein n=1 Tax=Dictyobacter kobayashii TaxID=2014872 RepID=A0A402ARU2_9CHLR|nr:hypothetical protein KDK_56180 [Dictyobacter kobayashii]